MLSPHRTGKGGGRGEWGVGLRLYRTGGAQECILPLVSESRGPHLGAQQASWAQVGGANALCSLPTPLVLEGPSCQPLLFSPRHSSMPPDEPSP